MRCLRTRINVKPENTHSGESSTITMRTLDSVVREARDAFLPCLEIDAAFHAGASLLAIEHAL
jgi:hypothetical protein